MSLFNDGKSSPATIEGRFRGKDFKPPEPKPKESLEPLHLYWLWHRGPSAVRGVVSAGTLCGKSKMARETVTVFQEDATCPICLIRAKERTG